MKTFDPVIGNLRRRWHVTSQRHSRRYSNRRSLLLSRWLHDEPSKRIFCHSIQFFSPFEWDLSMFVTKEKRRGFYDLSVLDSFFMMFAFASDNGFAAPVPTWCSMTRHGVEWFSMVSLIQHGAAWFGMLQHDPAWCKSMRHGAAWHGRVHDSAWCSMIRHGAWNQEGNRRRNDRSHGQSPTDWRTDPCNCTNIESPLMK